MKRRQKLYCITKPFAHVHSTMTALGFTAVGSKEGCDYDLMLQDPVSREVYWMTVPTSTAENGVTEVIIGAADFPQHREVPASAVSVAEDVLVELIDYLENSAASDTEMKPIEDIVNGMAHTEKELKQLGKEMAAMPTAAQLFEQGLIPDPIPY